MNTAFNYRHLYYFWMVAKEGSMSNAAARLDMAVQTVSTQVRELERDLGCQLLRPAGRGLALTEAGVVALRQAESIFQLGEALPEQVRAAAQSPSVRLVVGIADGLPKLEVQRLLRPVLQVQGLRLVCLEGEMPDLLAELALHKLDVVLSDHPAPFHPRLKVHNHPLGTSAMGWYAAPQWWAQAVDGFPASLQSLPVLLPTTHSIVRHLIDHWLAQKGLRPRVAGEFEDNALLEAFGGTGLGVFPGAVAAQDELLQRCQVRLVGACDGVQENYYAISTERKLAHPLVLQLVQRSAGVGAAR
ncbi:MAG: LysR family transcriptional regulator [Giesbergeria sp.]|jgi:LysR family transcriptional activator of nhaA|nr:LysR family transcriptional regulator [Giesbergeria sp.]MBP6159926.1 LysR family transcriptional regulator [Giesbergeria sp.]MBP7084135.1 LysR family transcriptional regulator [Giesbergeria sp.]MBP9784734.1 LysR family transcriptional regulator [Giesbergeria sp.]MBP9895676.1 LysR family transcriptional regulator [Giesbergeria sp.]